MADEPAARPESRSGSGLVSRIVRTSLLVMLALAMTSAAVKAEDAAIPEKLLRRQTAEMILASQPSDIRDRLFEQKYVVMQEIREPGAPPGMFLAYVLFEAPPARVYRFLSQTARQKEFRPELTGVETVSITPPGRSVEEYRLKVLFQRYVYRLEYRMDPEARRLEWSLAEGFENDLDSIEGFWELYEMEGDRTLGRFGTTVDAGANIPRFLQDWLTRKNLPKQMQRVRAWVDSGGTYRP